MMDMNTQKQRKQRKANNKMHLLFVYGTLKEGYSNNILLRGTEFIGKAVTIDNLGLISVGIPLAISSESTKEETKPIIGEVYKISSKVLEIVDILEGHPDMYKREIRKIKILESYEIIDAYIYLFQSEFLK